MCLKGGVVCIPPLADLIGHVGGGVAPEGATEGVFKRFGFRDVVGVGAVRFGNSRQKRVVSSSR